MKLNKKDVKVIVRLYERGHSILKIARMKHVNYYVIRMVLSNQGVEIRRLGQQFPLPNATKFKEDCDNLRIHELAKKYGVATGRISYWRNRLGLCSGKKELRSVIVRKQVNGCWKCVSHCGGLKGYPRGRGGQLIVKRNWIEKNGVWPFGMITRHLCAHKWCVNPDHVVPGTQLENLVDIYLDKGVPRKVFFNGMLTRGIQEEIIRIDDDGFVVRTVDNKKFPIRGSISLVVSGTFERLPAKRVLLRMNARGGTI